MQSSLEQLQKERYIRVSSQDRFYDITQYNPAVDTGDFKVSLQSNVKAGTRCKLVSANIPFNFDTIQQLSGAVSNLPTYYFTIQLGNPGAPGAIQPSVFVGGGSYTFSELIDFVVDRLFTFYGITFTMTYDSVSRNMVFTTDTEFMFLDTLEGLPAGQAGLFINIMDGRYDTLGERENNQAGFFGLNFSSGVGQQYMPTGTPINSFYNAFPEKMAKTSLFLQISELNNPIVGSNPAINGCFMLINRANKGAFLQFLNSDDPPNESFFVKDTNTLTIKLLDDNGRQITGLKTWDFTIKLYP